MRGVCVSRWKPVPSAFTTTISLFGQYGLAPGYWRQAA
jgi:hypothetical protein